MDRGGRPGRQKGMRYAPWGWMEWIDEWSSGSAVNVFRSVLLVEFVAEGEARTPAEDLPL